MRHRKTLYLGVFLLALGGLLLIAQNGALSDEAILNALTLWPAALVAAGAALLLRGTRLSLPAGVTAALLPGLLLGGVISVAPDLEFRCGGPDAPAVTRTLDGRLSYGSPVHLELSCGRLALDTAAGDGWRIGTGTTGSNDPIVEARSDGLVVRSADRTNDPRMSWAAETWQVTLPTDVLLDLRLEIDAADADIRLDGARLGDARFGVDAGALDLDLTGATIDRLFLEANAAAVTLVLPSGGNLIAELSLDAGDLHVCIPAGLAVRLSTDVELVDLDIRGLVRVGDAWETPGYALTTNRTDVTLEANVGSVSVQFEGDCK